MFLDANPLLQTVQAWTGTDDLSPCGGDASLAHLTDWVPFSPGREQGVLLSFSTPGDAGAPATAGAEAPCSSSSRAPPLRSCSTVSGPAVGTLAGCDPWIRTVGTAVGPAIPCPCLCPWTCTGRTALSRRTGFFAKSLHIQRRRPAQSVLAVGAGRSLEAVGPSADSSAPATARAPSVGPVRRPALLLG